MSWDWLDMVWHFPTPLWTKPHLVKCDLTADRNLNIIWFWSAPTLNGQWLVIMTIIISIFEMLIKSLLTSLMLLKDPKTQKLNDPKTRILNYPKTQRLTDPMTQIMISTKAIMTIIISIFEMLITSLFPSLMLLNNEVAINWRGSCQWLTIAIFFSFSFFAHHYLSTFFFAHLYYLFQHYHLHHCHRQRYSCRHHHRLYYSKNVIHLYFPLCWEALPIQ